MELNQWNCFWVLFSNWEQIEEGKNKETNNSSSFGKSTNNSGLRAKGKYAWSMILSKNNNSKLKKRHTHCIADNEQEPDASCVSKNIKGDSKKALESHRQRKIEKLAQKIKRIIGIEDCLVLWTRSFVNHWNSYKAVRKRNDIHKKDSKRRKIQ